MRRALLVVVAAALVAAPAAHAKTYCKLVKENPGDADPVYHAVPRGATPFAPYDLKSMDVATNATHLTGVIRVGDLTYDSPTKEHEAGLYAFAFSFDLEHSYALEAWVGGGRDRFELWRHPDPWLAPEDEGQSGTGVQTIPAPVLVGRARGVVDLKTNEIRMTVPLSIFGRGVVARSTKITHLGGNSASYKLWVDQSTPATSPGWFFGQHEDAVSARAWDGYPIGAPSCVKVGR
jgi:hypothetical protein